MVRVRVRVRFGSKTDPMKTKSGDMSSSLHGA